MLAGFPLLCLGIISFFKIWIRIFFYPHLISIYYNVFLVNMDLGSLAMSILDEQVIIDKSNVSCSWINNFSYSLNFELTEFNCQPNYSNPILFVTKILLLFRKQAIGNSWQIRVSIFLSTFWFVATYGRIAIYVYTVPVKTTAIVQ